MERGGSSAAGLHGTGNRPIGLWVVGAVCLDGGHNLLPLGEQGLAVVSRTQVQIGRPATCVYWILVRTVPPPVSCESYGVCITMLQTGEREEVLDITVRPERILSLAQMLARGGVTPCTLREVIDDWL